MPTWMPGVQHRAGAQVALIATLTLAMAAFAGAQQVDSLPFRAGQWAAEFTTANFSLVGALRFTSPSNAWLIDVQVNEHGKAATSRNCRDSKNLTK